MINASEIVDALVNYLRDIPELVQAMEGDADRIYAYHDRYPQNVSLDAARGKMPSPGIMVAWQGTFPGSNGEFEAWEHEISITLRAKPESSYIDAAAYYNLFRLITKGVPTGQPQPLIYLTVHESCNPMNIPTIRRQTDAAGIDYFEISTSFTEIGDD